MALRAMEFKSGMDVVVQVFYTLSAQHSFRTVCPRPSSAIAIAILQLRKPAFLCQYGAVAFITISLNRVYL
ncbi:hypothetical protein P692DRAFT_20836408, partial [Suillus brevipes Sb2]